MLTPFLKWAGGKRQLLPALLPRVPDRFGTYFEPFIGGGAMLFALRPNKAVIGDINDEIVNCYFVIRDDPSELRKFLDSFPVTGRERVYYKIRGMDRRPDFPTVPRALRAARTIFFESHVF
ncbi:modification methylase DpnIIA [Peptococcaceae bacterium CEB3]|nr:modification methylase DpnIIA [Peptococcaceae bacterium CEB3]